MGTLGRAIRGRKVLDEALAGAEEALAATFDDYEIGSGGGAVLVGDVDGGRGAVSAGRGDQLECDVAVSSASMMTQGGVEVEDMLGDEANLGGDVGDRDEPLIVAQPEQQGPAPALQAAVATSSLNFADGVIQPSVWRGRSLSSAAMASSRWSVTVPKSRPRGRYWRSSPLAFSLVPRCQGACGSQKYTATSVATEKPTWAAISLP